MELKLHGRKTRNADVVDGCCVILKLKLISESSLGITFKCVCVRQTLETPNINKQSGSSRS